MAERKWGKSYEEESIENVYVVFGEGQDTFAVTIYSDGKWLHFFASKPARNATVCQDF